MNRKVFNAPMEFKADEQTGEFSAVFATLGVIDHDGDVTLPGAFGKQDVIIESWNHNYAAPPVGKGSIIESGNEAVVNGRFFLQTEAGKEHYEVAKELGGAQEFSYTFNITEAEYGKLEGRDVRFLKGMEVFGVGQVTRGAGIATRLTAIKSHPKPEQSEDEAGNAGKSSASILTEINIAEIEMIVRNTRE
jgi:hypothetical protein